MLVPIKVGTSMASHTNSYKFGWNISSDISNAKDSSDLTQQTMIVFLWKNKTFGLLSNLVIAKNRTVANLIREEFMKGELSPFAKELND